MDRKELIKKYNDFFISKNHARIKNSSLVPENDPTVLFTTAGMHPLVPYLLGEPHPQGKRVCNVQRCIRTGDIEEVGDTTHHTFFEMLGNWSIGDYFKEEAINMSYEFLTKVLEIPKERLGVTVFGGDKDFPQIPVDDESVEIWKSQGVPEERITKMPGGVANQDDNWWGPAGQTGPCGPSTEMFYWKDNERSAPANFDPEEKIKGGNEEAWVEIWNDVLMEYVKDPEGNFNKASQQNVDTGMGLERTIAVLDGFEDNYLASMWKPIIERIEELSSKSYEGNEKAMRVIADHIKAASFIINDGVVPSNTEQGYVLRRLIRRAIRFGKTLGLENFTTKIAEPVYELYDDYELDKEKINSELEKEEVKFNQTLEKGMRIFEKKTGDSQELDGKTAFLLYQSYGFPIEMTEELCNEKNIQLDKQGFEQAKQNHKELSRTASAGRFKSGLADDSKATTALHTACHLLNEALRQVLKTEINQKGSNITPERLRFDFTFDRKLTDEEVKQVEDLVNEKIKENIPIQMSEVSLEEAKASGAHGVFDDKYGEKVKVYTIGNFSKEICAGPHVENTSELGHFKIKKQKSVGAGARRIKAVLE